MSLILFCIILAIAAQIPNAVRWHQRTHNDPDGTGYVAGSMIVLIAVLAFAAANM